MNSIRYWNNVSLQLVADDYSFRPLIAGQPPIVRPDGAGPTGTARNLAIIHLAMYNVVRIASGLAPFWGVKAPPQLPIPLPPGMDVDAAIGAAAAAAARSVYPSHAATIQAAEANFGNTLPQNFNAVMKGIDFGRKVALNLVEVRAKDGSAEANPNHAPSTAPCKHREDPHHIGQGYFGAKWGGVDPFTYKDVTKTKISAPPPCPSEHYYKDYVEVEKYGRDNLPYFDQAKATIGVYWAYDGPNKLGTPPRLYNQIAGVIADQANAGRDSDARLFALINIGMCDAGIAAWHWKYIYEVWRPVIGIREAGEIQQLGGSGPSEQGDGNAKTLGNPFWCPLGAQASNAPVSAGGMAPATNFTPNFPAYPSGHATFGTTCFNLIAKHYGKPLKKITFNFVSDELNGITRDVNGVQRPRVVKHYNLEEAIKDNGESRIWLGVHWRFDADGGLELGEDVAKKVLLAI